MLYICADIRRQTNLKVVIFQFNFFLIFKKILLLFTVVGHSYILPHRTFGRIKIDFRSKSTIVDHQEYEGMIKSFETVF